MKQRSWLQSESFLKRSFAIYGHALFAHLLVSAALLLVWTLVMGVAATIFLHTMGMRDGRTGKPVHMMMRDEVKDGASMMEREGKRQDRSDTAEPVLRRVRYGR